MAVNGKQKGSSFEREICVKLSKWITKGEKIDCLWRSAMSGGRATVKRGQVRQAGDICAVSSEGHALTDHFYIECKAYKDINLDCLVKGKGVLLDFWGVAVKEAAYYNKVPMLIFKRNHWPIVVCIDESGRKALGIGLEFVLVRSGSMVLLKFDSLISRPFRIIP